MGGLIGALRYPFIGYKKGELLVVRATKFPLGEESPPFSLPVYGGGLIYPGGDYVSSFKTSCSISLFFIHTHNNMISTISGTFKEILKDRIPFFLPSEFNCFMRRDRHSVNEVLDSLGKAV